MARTSAALVLLALHLAALDHRQYGDGGCAVVATPVVGYASVSRSAGEDVVSGEEEEPAEELWLEDDELARVLAALDRDGGGAAAAPRHSRPSLEERVGMLLEDEYYRGRQEEEEEEERDDVTGDELGGDAVRDGVERGLRKGYRKKRKRGRGGRAGGRGGGYRPHLHGNAYKTDVHNRKYRHVCLDIPDPYRTCFARALDPANDLEEGACDQIQRNSYNLGALLYKKGRTIPDGLPAPYTEPYVVRGWGRTREGGEVRTEGRMHISLFQTSKKASRQPTENTLSRQAATDSTSVAS